MAVAFLVGLLAPAAYGARAIGSYKKVYGHSTSCTLVRATVNNTTRKGGGETHNFAGCSSSEPSLAVPPGYLGVSPNIRRDSNDWTCNGEGSFWVYNQTTTSTLKASNALAVGYSTCPQHVAYYGESLGRRWQQTNSVYSTVTSYRSPSLGF